MLVCMSVCVFLRKCCSKMHYDALTINSCKSFVISALRDVRIYSIRRLIEFYPFSDCIFQLHVACCANAHLIFVFAIFIFDNFLA